MVSLSNSSFTILTLLANSSFYARSCCVENDDLNKKRLLAGCGVVDCLDLESDFMSAFYSRALSSVENCYFATSAMSLSRKCIKFLYLTF